jgi:hypothetical protein
MSSQNEIKPITFTTTSTVIEKPKKRGRSKKNGDSSTNTKTTTNTTTITITPKFIDMDNLEPGSDMSSLITSSDNKIQNQVISSSLSPETNPRHENITHNTICEQESEDDDQKSPNVININIEIDTIDNPDMMNLNNDEDDNKGLYNVTQFNYDLLIPFILINMHASSRESILALLQTTLINCIEGRCIAEGFIKPDTVRIVDFKCGKIVAKNVQFNLVIECEVCNPAENSIITCIAKNITQAGIRAISSDEYLPVVVYISKDYSLLTQNNSYYNTIKEGDKIRVKVIGKRFEMNDKFIQIVGDLVSPKKERLIIKNAKKVFTSSSLSSSIGEILSNAISNSNYTSTSTSSSKSSSSSTSTSSTSQPISESKTSNVTTKVAKEPKASKQPKATKVAKEPKKKIKSNVITTPATSSE